jgi:RNA polymerase sigma-70 factor, ECF subfamily
MFSEPERSAASTNASPRPEEFDAAVLAFREALLARAMRLALSPAAAHDLVQDTLERAFRCAGRFQWGTNLRGWLQTLMFNIFVDHYRMRSHETSLEPLTGDNLPAPEPDPEPAWASIPPASLEAALRDLPEPLRRVFELRFDLGLEYLDIARALEIPVGTVGTRLHRARKWLRRSMADEVEALQAA